MQHSFRLLVRLTCATPCAAAAGCPALELLFVLIKPEDPCKAPKQSLLPRKELRFRPEPVERLVLEGWNLEGW